MVASLPHRRIRADFLVAFGSLALLLALARPIDAFAQAGPVGRPDASSMGGAGRMGWRGVVTETPANSSDPTGWDGFSKLGLQVQRTLKGRGELFQAPQFGANVKINNPAGDQTSDAQYFTTVAAWGRFVVAAFVDTKGADGPAGAPANTFCGYAFSCDWGATWTDGGSFPRLNAGDQIYQPSIATDGRGKFYVVAPANLGNDGSGNFSSYGIAFFTGTFDTVACTFAWAAPQYLETEAAGPTTFGPDFCRIVTDPYDDYLYLVYTETFQSAPYAIRFKSSPNGGATWNPYVTLNTPGAGTNFPYFGDLAVGPNHELYATWADDAWYFWCDLHGAPASYVQFNRSLDRGATWAGQSDVSPLYTTYFSNGPLDRFGGHKTFPRLAVDRSGGPNRGNVYLTWAASGAWNAPTGTGTIVNEVSSTSTLPSSAQSLTLGDDAWGTLTGSADVDWWTVDLAAGQTLLARVEPQGYACSGALTQGVTIRLYPQFADPGVFPGDTLLAAHNTTNYVGDVVFTAKVSGTYYIRLSTFLTTNVAYQMKSRAISFYTQSGSGRDESDIVFARSLNGGATWQTPFVVNAGGATGYHENGPDIACDASGRLLLSWFSHYETETAPRLTLRGQLTDVYLSESVNGGASFAAGKRVTDENTLGGLNIKSTLTQVGFHTELATDGDHLMSTWDDQRISTRLSESLNAYGVLVDRESPVITWLSGPSEGEFINAAAAKTWGWTGIDRRRGYAGNTYQWGVEDGTGAGYLGFNGFTGESTATAAPAELATLPDGHYFLAVYGRDGANNTAVLPTRRGFYADLTSPTPTISAGPANGATVSTPSVTFAWSATDNFPAATYPGNALRYSYELDLARSPYPPLGMPSGSSVTRDDLSAGPHTWKVWALDAAGNESSPITRTFTYEIPAPAPTVSAALDQPLTFTWQQVPAIANAYRIEIATDASGLNIVHAETVTATSFTYTGLTFDGNRYYARVTPSSDGGATFPYGSSAFGAGLIVDRSAPAVVFVSGPPQGGHTNATDVTIGWSGNDGANGVGGIEYAFAVLPAGLGPFGTETSATLPGLPEGPHTLQVVARDALGNSAPVTLDFVVDRTPPETQITSGPANSSINGGPITITFAGTDDRSSAAQLEFSTSLDGAAFTPFSATTTAALGVLPDDGQHYFFVAARDAAGNVDPSADTRTFVTWNQAPAVTFLTHPSSAGYNLPKAAFTWTSTVSPIADPSATMYEWQLDGGGWSTLSRDTFVTFPFMSDGPHVLVVRAHDNQFGGGLQGTAIAGWTVDGSAPVLMTVSGPSYGEWRANRSQTFGWTSSDLGVGGASSRYSLDGGTIVAAAANDTAHFDALADGLHQFAADFVDALGNATVTTPQCERNPAGATHWWKGNGTAFDAIAENDTASSGVVYTPSPRGYAFAFSGNGWVTSLSGDMEAGPGSFSIEAWFRTTGDDEIIVSQWEGTPSLSYTGYDLGVSGGALAFRVGDNSDVGWQSVSSGGVVLFNDGAWHHAIATRDMTAGTLNLYADGVLLSSDPLGSGGSGYLGDPAQTDVPLVIGATLRSPADGGGFENLFTGDIDDVVFSNVALKSPAVASLYPDGRNPLDCQFGYGIEFGIDGTPPETQIVSGPGEGQVITSTTTVSILVGATDNHSAANNTQFSYSLDGGPYSPFNPNYGLPYSFNLGQGGHTFTVMAKDEVGNIDPTPATRSFVIHTQVPVPTIIAGPPLPPATSSPPSAFTWTLSAFSAAAPRDSIRFDYRVDGGTWTPTAGPTDTSATVNAGAGSHVFEVRATDNIGLQYSATRNFNITSALAGSYTVGAGGTYSTLQAAITALTTQGISGPVSLLIASGTYTETVTIGAIPGASATNRIRIVSQTGNAADVTLRAPATNSTGTDAVVVLNGAQYVSFDSLKITATGAAGANGALVWLTGTSMNNRFLGCTLVTVTASQSVMRGAASGTVNLAGLEVRSCQMTAAQLGSYVFFLGSGSCDNAVFQGNTITTTGSDALNITATSTGMSITGNTFSMNGGVPLYLYFATSPVIRGNRITGAGTGITYGNNPGTGLIANNFIQASAIALSITSLNLGTVSVVYNSLNASGSGQALFLNGGSAGIVTLKNNVLSCPAGAVPLNASGGAAQFIASDYNDLFTPGPTLATYGVTNYATLASLRTGTGLETHSVSILPLFVSTTDLHSSSPVLNGAATPIAAVLDDIDGEPRDASTPDIGADEFSTVVVPLAGTYTIGASGDYPTISAATADLALRGVSAPVSLLIQSGTYTGSIVLPLIAGVSATNRIRFVSQTGNAADVTLQAPATNNAGTDAVVRLENVQYVSFDSLKITATGAASNGGALVWLSANATNNRFLGCTMSTVPISQNVLRAASGTNANGLELRNCQLTVTQTGGYPVYLASGSCDNAVFQGNTFTVLGGNEALVLSENCAGLQVLGNTFSMAGATALSVAFSTSPVIRGNRISGATTGILYGNNSGAGLIANNFIQATTNPLMIQSLGGGGGTVSVVYNSLNATGPGNGVSWNGGSAGSTSLRNNAVACPGGGIPIFSNTGTAVLASSDYNDFYTSGVTIATINGASYSTLAALRTGTGFETHGILANPVFASTTDLHASAVPLNGAGTPVAAVLDDIDGEPRDATTPDIGADEFNTALTPMAGTYTIGASGDYASLAAAATDLNLRGISGPTSFLIQNGTYDGSTLLTPVSGASATNRIRFVSQSGSAASVTLRAPATASTGTDAVIRLDGGRYMDFDSLSITTSGGSATNSGLVWLSNASINDRFQGCAFNTVGSIRSALRGLAGQVANGLEVRNCAFTLAGSSNYAVFLSGGTSDNAVIANNTVTSTATSATAFNLTATSTGLQVLGNTITVNLGTGMVVGNANYPTIRGNKISGAANGLSSSQNFGGLVANNFIQAATTPFVLQAQGSSFGGLVVAYNSFNATGTSSAINMSGGATTGTITVLNNVFASTTATPFTATHAASQFVALDYNDYYSTGAPSLVVFGGTSYPTLAALRSATGLETHGVNANPAFASSTNLHTSSPALDGTATPLAAVLDDIDSQLRDPVTPDIGADEFSSTPDVTPPTTTIVAGPADGGWNASTTATFTWTGADDVTAPASMRYSYRFDGGAWGAVGTTTTASFAAPEGPHTFEVYAIDAANNADATPAMSNFTVDVTSPETQIVSGPAEGATIVTSTAVFVADATDNLASAGQLNYRYRLNGGAWSAFAATATVTLTNLSEGAQSLEIAARDAAGNVDATPATRGFVVHVEAPSKLIVSGPGAYTTQTDVTFEFSADSSQPPATIEFSYRLDSGAWSPYGATTTATFTGVAEGNHVFGLRARDSYGLEDQLDTPFAVDLTDPNTTITGTPADGGWAAAADVLMTYSGTDNLAPANQLQFFHRTDGGAWTGPVSATSTTLNALAPGPHTFEAYAVDPAGHADASPASRSFTVDLGTPETQIVAGPGDGTVVDGNSVTLTLDGSDDWTPPGQLKFQTRVNAGAWGASVASYTATFTGLADGPRTIDVRAVDLAGNLDPTPATRSYVIDALPPSLTIDSGPAANACLAVTSASFAWSATDVVSPPSAIQYAWTLDGAPYTPFGTDQSAALSALAEGPHTISIQARDERGHVSTLARSFRVDVTAPVANAPTTRVLDANSIQITCTGTDGGGVTAFHAEVSTDPAFGTVLYSTNVGASGVFNYTGTPGSTYYARATASDCAGNTSAFSGPSNGATLANLPDLVVTQVSVPPTATSGQVVPVAFTVSNTAIGATNVPQWSDDLYLSPTPTFDIATATFLARIQNLTFLASGESYTGSANVTIPLGLNGNYYVIVLSDNLNNVPETNGSNNTRASSAIAVALGDYADLKVTQVVAPPTALTGESVTITWTVQNQGTGRTNTDNWYDTIVYSTDAAYTYVLAGSGSIRVDDAPLGSFHHVGALDPGESYTRSETVTVPDGAGTRYFIAASDVKVDYAGQYVSERGSVFEHVAEINAAVAESTEVTQTLPPDLVVESVTGPATGSSGRTLSVGWTVRNNGFNPTPNTAWTDRVWLSPDAVLGNGNDVQLGQLSRSGALALSAAYTQSASFGIPNGLAGSFYLIVQADVFGQLGEYLETNNTGQRAGLVSVALSPWPNLVPTDGTVTDTVVAGGVGTAMWNVVNAGAASLNGNWRDDVFLSSSATWNPGNARNMGSASVARTLNNGQSYGASLSFTVPSNFSGLYYVYVQTDAGNAVYEHTDEGDNIAPVAALYAKPYPPVDLVVSNVAVPATATAGTPLSVGYVVTNAGQAPTLNPGWSEDVWLSADPVLDGGDYHLASPGHYGHLSPAGNYSRTSGNTIPNGFSGVYYAIVRTDPGAASGDGNLSNNTAVSAATVAISAPQPPDVVVSAMTAPSSATAGQPLHVDYTVGNPGPGDILGRIWFAAAYLSLDPYLDGGDVSLGSAAGPTTLAAGGSQAGALDVTLPVWASGAYYLIVSGDSRNDLWEGSNEGNNTRIAPLLVNLPPPADLIVQDVVVPPAGTPGEPVTVSFTLLNQGTNPAVGTLHNAVYVSTDGSFESSSDPLVGMESQSVNLPPGGSAQFTQRVVMTRPIEVDAMGNVTGQLPSISPGSYYAIVHANVKANVRELDLTNNEAVSGVTLQADVPALTLGTGESLTLTEGQSRYYKVTVPAGQDLTFDLSTDVPNATNELYVSFGSAASGQDFDFSGPPEFTATPRVLVPGTEAGAYYVMVLARDLGTGSSIEHASLLARTLPFSLTSIAPAAGGEAGRVTCHLRGAGLREATLVRLEQSGITIAIASLARFVNSTDLEIRWDLTGVPQGVYDVVAVNGTETVLLPGAFTVEAARPMAVEIQTLNPDVLRRTATGQFIVKFHNPSNQDVPVLKARVFYPASSTLRNLDVTPGLFRRSDQYPTLFAPLTGDAFIAHDQADTDSVAVIDLIAADLSPGETRSVTVGVSGFATSPYSLRAVAQAFGFAEFLNREVEVNEAARLSVLANPDGVPAAALTLAGDPYAFRDQALLHGFADPGVLSRAEVEDYLVRLPGNAQPSTVYHGSSGPPELLDALASGEPCFVPEGIPECSPDVTVSGSALPACVVVFDAALPFPLNVGGGVVAKVTASTVRGYSETRSADARVVTPCDPNLMTGPAGFGDQRWVNAAQPLAYRVDFENLPAIATAPAQVVKVTVPLDANLDLTSFRLGSLGFGTHTIAVPPDRTSYSAEPFYGDLGLRVRVTAGINLATREATWTLTTIDPATGQQPTNPYIGFLPVNDPTGQGTGFVNFSIRPFGAAVSGSDVAAQASIKFDANAPLLTVQARNKLDTTLPSSAVLPSVQVLDSTRVRVQWTGQDAPGGAGLGGVALYMKRDAGAFELYQGGLAVNQLEVPVTSGHLYYFYTLATDNTGNQEPAKSAPDAAVTVGTPNLDVDEGPAVPSVNALYQNFPNPFSGTTQVRFDLARGAEATLEIFDVQGRLVSRPLSHKALGPGRHVVEVGDLPRGAGVYFYRLSAGAFVQTRRMVLLR